MFSDVAIEFNSFFEKGSVYLGPWLICIGILWVINLLNWSMGSRLNYLGLYPRHLFGLLGIFFCPILHQNFTHLFFNTIPLFALGLALLAKGVETFYQVTLGVVVGGGFLVWLFGRSALHIGASGLVSGYFGYILTMAILEPSFTSTLLAGTVLYYFGGIFLGIFPEEEKLSWESHLFGFLAGIGCAFLPPCLIPIDTLDCLR